MKNTNKKTSLILGVLLITIVFCGILTSINIHPAQSQQYTLLEPLPKLSDSGQASLSDKVELSTYIKDAINLLIALSAVAAVFMIVWGGLQYMTTDSWGKKSDGLKKATDAIIGLLMILSTYIILQAVNPAMLKIATIKPICDSTGSVAKGNACPKYSSANDSQSFFQTLEQQAATYSAETANLMNQRNQIRTQVTALEENLNALKQQYNGPATDQATRDLLATQIEDTKNQIDDAVVPLILSTAQATISAQLNYTLAQSLSDASKTPTEKLAIIQTSKGLINQAYNTAVDNLTLYDGDIEENFAVLDTQYYYTYGELLLQESVALNSAIDGIKKIEAEVKTGMLDKLPDGSQQKNQLKSDTDAAMRRLCTFAPNYSSCSAYK